MSGEDLDLALLTPVLAGLAPQGRSSLLPALHAAQELYGYLPEQVAAEIASALRVPLADVFGVIDFYTLFYREPVGKNVIQVCDDPVCALAGADSVYKIITHKMEHQIGSSITLERSPCLGLCESAPALLYRGLAVANLDDSSYEAMVAGKLARPRTHVAGECRVLTANCGEGAKTSLEEYTLGGGYAGLRKALQIQPQEVIEAVKAAGLVGRGGAAFPTGVKWESAAAAAGSPKYVVCNADEAEPGTFKDRVMMEEDPHRILEGILIAAYAIGAKKGFMYIRGEYFYPYRVMKSALEEALQAGYLGENILGSGFSFDLELRRGAGAYVCGEETALFESIEGKRGFPRVKPPFPTTHGLFGQPTVINNVETLANVPSILRDGPEQYRGYGTKNSPGTKLFCLSGDVAQPGLYEVPFGVSFRHLLYDLAGGIRPGHHFQSALFGGAAGAFATEKNLDVGLSFENLRSAGLPLGSGVITVFDETRDIRDVLVRLGRFFAEESCGKCFPCQIGTQRQYEILQRVASNHALPEDKMLLQDLGSTMTDASLCGLGQTAASAVMSALRLWPDRFEPGRQS
jgi:NADH-quinone oxidoreductase subunit F